MTQVFVFGSNTAGRHGKGAALFAKRVHNARQGIGEGLTGNAYAIPTKKESKTERNRRGEPKLVARVLDDIHRSVELFTRFARENPQHVFLVTELGCGLAGYSVRDIAPLFQTAVKYPNVYLPERFLKVLHMDSTKMSFDRDNNKVYSDG